MDQLPNLYNLLANSPESGLQTSHHDISSPLSAEVSKCHWQWVLISPDVTYSHVGEEGGLVSGWDRWPKEEARVGIRGTLTQKITFFGQLQLQLPAGLRLARRPWQSYAASYGECRRRRRAATGPLP